MKPTRKSFKPISKTELEPGHSPYLPNHQNHLSHQHPHLLLQIKLPDWSLRQTHANFLNVLFSSQSDFFY